MSTELSLTKQAKAATNWHTALNANFTAIETIVGSLPAGQTTIGGWISALLNEVQSARGELGSIDARLDVSLDEYGTLKASASIAKWANSGHSATQISSSIFQISGGDYTAFYTEGRPIRLNSTAMVVDSSEYTGGNTNVTVRGGTVPATITQVDYSIIDDESLPRKLSDTFTAKSFETEIASADSESSALTIDLSGEAIQPVTLTGDVSFDVSNIPAETSVCVNVILSTASSDRTLTFDSDWQWLGAKPTTLYADTSAVLALMNVGPNATDIIAAYGELS